MNPLSRKGMKWVGRKLQQVAGGKTTALVAPFPQVSLCILHEVGEFMQVDFRKCGILGTDYKVPYVLSGYSWL